MDNLRIGTYGIYLHESPTHAVGRYEAVHPIPTIVDREHVN